MGQIIKQHVIDPELCIRCYTCEETCTIGAISHNDDNVVVDASICAQCMDCISPCPTGSIDNWRVVDKPYSVEEQLGWMELPDQEDIAGSDAEGLAGEPALDSEIEALLVEARRGAARAVAPSAAASPTVNSFPISQPLEAVVQGNFRLTGMESDSDVRHLIINLDKVHFPLLEGQSIGIIAPGLDANGKAHQPRLFSIASPRDGERENVNNLALTVKREPQGVCSNYLCDLQKGDSVKICGPYGQSFLMPDDANAKLIMICTGTGSAPFRAFTMRRQRKYPHINGTMMLFFGARTPESLPYFGPLTKIPEEFVEKHFAYSRVDGEKKTYVQDKLREHSVSIGKALLDTNTHIYICGLKAMEAGVEAAFEKISKDHQLEWQAIRKIFQAEGRYHVETY